MTNIKVTNMKEIQQGNLLSTTCLWPDNQHLSAIAKKLALLPPWKKFGNNYSFFFPGNNLEIIIPSSSLEKIGNNYSFFPGKSLFRFASVPLAGLVSLSRQVLLQIGKKKLLFHGFTFSWLISLYTP